MFMRAFIRDAAALPRTKHCGKRSNIEELLEKPGTRIPQRFPNVLVDAAESDAQLFKYTWHNVVFPYVGRGFS